jgi:MoaA/NifB/PqqE/SkfB family radical SAM enzyme
MTQTLIRPKVAIDQLMFELGRWCQQMCEHCCRGKRQRDRKNHIQNMKAVITKTLEQIESIGVLTFTGGEPFLYISLIKHTLKELKRLRVSVHYFYVATNGQILNAKIFEVIYDMYDYCDEPDMFSIKVSADQLSRIYSGKA